MKVERLVEMGFDRVVLLEFIPNPPAMGIDSRAWMLASDIAVSSEEAVAAIFKSRLANDTVAGH